MQLRSQSIDVLKIARPAPDGPKRLSGGTSQSWKLISPIGEVRNPILWISRLTDRPGVSRSTRKAETPANPWVGSVLAKTTKMSATGAFVMKVLFPLRMKPRPFLSARVPRLKASDPEAGSVIACTPMIDPSHRPGRKRLF